MNHKTVLFIAGTRPEAIKIAPLVLEMRRRAKWRVRLCATAQHRGLLDQVLTAFDLTPDFDLDLMSPDQTLAGITARLFDTLPRVFDSTKPDCVVVQGDTTSAFAGALCAFYERVPVAHIEAGLRTRDIYAPFPEEVNRRLVSTIARWHFAPTTQARDNLLRECVPPENVYVVGNTVIDALQDTARRKPQVSDALKSVLAGPMILVTGHRRESFGKGMTSVCNALARIATAHPEVELVYPVHPNPKVLEPVKKILGKLPNVLLTDPVDYPSFVALMQACRFLISDSGGVQEEAPALGKPVLVTREVTERPEAVTAGGAMLVGTDEERIVSAAEELLREEEMYQRMSQASNPFGDGNASAKICDVLAKELRKFPLR